MLWTYIFKSIRIANPPPPPSPLLPSTPPPSTPPPSTPSESANSGNSRIILTRFYKTVTYTHTQSKYIGRNAVESDVSSDVVVACDVSSDGTTGTLQYHTCLGARSSNQTSIHNISEERVADKPEPIHCSSTIRNASYKMKRGPAWTTLLTFVLTASVHDTKLPTEYLFWKTTTVTQPLLSTLKIIRLWQVEELT